eukprot:SAG31_NODE_33541_length_342_cov_1.279835_1_plen_32_part_01
MPKVTKITNSPNCVAHLQARGVLVWCLGVNDV